MRKTRQFRRRSAVMAGAGMAALVGAGLFAGSASAHNADWSVTCDAVHVHLTAYDSHARNSVTVSVVGGSVLDSKNSFGGSYTFNGALPDHDSAIKVHLVVKAGDSRKYDRDETLTSQPCEKPPTSPPVEETTTPPVEETTTPPVEETTTPPVEDTTTPPVEETTTPPAEETTTPPVDDTTAPTATTTSPAVAGTSSAPGGGDLAETGSSSATPMIAGIAGVAVVAGAGVLFFSRKRRSGAHR
ncbi:MULTISPECIES: LAETG motif-containing sortase-dependent surface protein [unclassified Streptomyces]|uniref:LAETG motif-containing sortase-dependent surface protein n=1 Tax=unclassified Streptomyces TaxID=2593676 RepID=UPI002E2CA0D6|nr:LAETG motif-containing sortase-dependent surface protein [Streptomyces sp. NBC_00223]